LILEEYGPEVVHIKGIHNTVADAISRLDFTPALTSTWKDCQNWMTITKCCCDFLEQETTHPNSIKQHLEPMYHVFANCIKDDEIYPLTVTEIAEEQHKDKNLCALHDEEQFKVLLMENTKVLFKDGKW
jgi:hypothetical protein